MVAALQSKSLTKLRVKRKEESTSGGHMADKVEGKCRQPMLLTSENVNLFFINQVLFFRRSKTQ